MQNESNAILQDELKNLIKIVILGYISLDFFSPLTFKFIANEFSSSAHRKTAFVVFKVLYITTPFVGYVTYQIVAKQYLLLKNELSKSSRFSFMMLLACLVMALVVAFFCLIPSDNVFFGNFLFAAIVTNLVFIVGAYLYFDYLNNKIVRPYPVIRKKCLVRVLVAFALTIIIITGVFHFHHRSIEDLNQKYTLNSAMSLYESPFDQQEIIENNENNLKQFNKYDLEVKEYTYLIESFVKTYNDEVAIERKINKKTPLLYILTKKQLTTKESDSTVLKDVVKITKDIHSELNPSSFTLGKAKVVNNQLILIRDFMDFYQFQIEKKLNATQSAAVSSAKRLLKYVQGIDLIIIATLLFSLYVFFETQTLINLGEQKNVVLRSALILYVLIFVQMLKPVDPNHINLKDLAWPFTYTNWYLPGYVQSIGSLNNTTINEDNREFITTDLNELHDQISKIESDNRMIKNNIVSLDTFIRKVKRKDTVVFIGMPITEFREKLDKIDKNTRQE